MGLRWTKDQYNDYLMKQSQKEHKYKAKETIIDEIKFASQKEAQYYMQLKLLKQAGEIKDFALQPKYELLPSFEKNGKKYRPITYIADFLIVNNDGSVEVVDIKGFETQVFKIKQKLFEYNYPDLTLKVVK